MHSMTANLICGRCGAYGRFPIEDIPGNADDAWAKKQAIKALGRVTREKGWTMGPPVLCPACRPAQGTA